MKIGTPTQMVELLLVGASYNYATITLPLGLVLQSGRFVSGYHKEYAHRMGVVIGREHFSHFDGSDTKGPNIGLSIIRVLFDHLWCHPEVQQQ